MAGTQPISDLKLIAVEGPPMEPILLTVARAPYVVGRSRRSDVVLDDSQETVSRLHLRAEIVDNAWHVTDLGSKHGTKVNYDSLVKDTPHKIATNDRLRISPWTFRLVIGADPHTTEVFKISDDSQSTEHHVEKFAPLQDATQRRLDLILQAAASLSKAEDEVALAATTLDSLCAATDLARAAYVKFDPATDQVTVIASRGTGPGQEPIVYSRSLLQQAVHSSDTVVLTSGTMSGGNIGESIFVNKVATAVCSPILIDNRIVAFVYLESRASRSQPFGYRGPGSQGPVISAEAIDLCRGITRIAGLTLANIERLLTQRDNERARTELEAAREVQRMIMPPTTGTFGRIRYVMYSRPGRRVAGDLFDFFPIDPADPEGQVAVLIGDVEGKGIGAGMVMANVQAHLSRLLRTTGDPAAALNDVGRIVCGYSARADNRGRAPTFLTLWVALIDQRAGTLTAVDAGHGHALMKPSDAAEFRKPGVDPFTPLGIDADPYAPSVLPFGPGSRLLLYTDGLVEQPAPDGKHFGHDRALAVLRPSRAPDEDVESLTRALSAHAKLPPLDPNASFNDDVTVASIVFS
jgi:serine phosphatase RsbU (regulator of sigma subunit)